jgi:uncharacterized membrane protein
MGSKEGSKENNIKKFELKNELIIINILSFILILIISFTNLKALRIILGLPFILFFPGYTLISALFVKKKDLDSLERIALSFGLSIAVVPLIGLLLNYTPWGIRLYPILFSIFIFILIMSIIAYYRRNKIPEADRFKIYIEINKPNWKETSLLDKILSIVLICSIIFAIGTLIYIIVTPKVGERFTEFYILGPSGKAEGYPRNLKLKEEGKVIIGIVNHEHEEVVYNIEIKIKGKIINSIGPIVLKNEEKWEKLISFIPKERGKNIKVEFLLYRKDREEVYRDLHIWIDVE